MWMEGAQLCIPAATTVPMRAWEVPLVLSQSETQDLPISLKHSLLFTMACNSQVDFGQSAITPAPCLAVQSYLFPVELLWNSRSETCTNSNSSNSHFR